MDEIKKAFNHELFSTLPNKAPPFCPLKSKAANSGRSTVAKATAKEATTGEGASATSNGTNLKNKIEKTS